MREGNIIDKIILFLRWLFVPQSRREQESRKIKEEMCRKAIQGDICPKHCEGCAWYGGKR